MPTTAEHVARHISPLRRAVVRRTRAAADLPDLPDAQVEVLRLLADQGPLTSGQIADALCLARSTVSNLLKALEPAGLVRRTRDGDDLRLATVGLLPRATDLLRRYDHAATATVQQGLERLDAADRAALAAAAPALERLAAAIAGR